MSWGDVIGGLLGGLAAGGIGVIGMALIALKFRGAARRRARAR